MGKIEWIKGRRTFTLRYRDRCMWELVLHGNSLDLEDQLGIPADYLTAASEAPGEVVWPYDPKWEELEPIRTVGWIDRDDPGYSGEELELLEEGDGKILARFTTFGGNEIAEGAYSCYVILDEEEFEKFRSECQRKEWQEGAEFFDEAGAWDG